MKDEFWRNEKEGKYDVLIVDGYVDEPSLLGVPPYISPEPRLLAGIAEKHDYNWEYVTVDEYRINGLPRAEKILVHGGVTVPGTYLSAEPMDKEEAEKIARAPGETFLGGPLARYSKVDGYNHYSKKDLAAYFNDFIQEESRDRWSTPREREEWLKKGAKVVQKHPMFPDPLIAETGMYRGCPRYFTGGCSFCSEPDYGKPVFREQEDIIGEIELLYDSGLRNFRLGGQSCTISYKGERIGKKEVPIPRPDEIEKLFSGIWDSCPDHKVLHLDNANPAVISKYPLKSREILETLTRYTTAGNILALGIESADLDVIEKNNLNARPEQVMKAVELINEIGREKGRNGMPKLLPGINFLVGLKGETVETFEKNLRFLKKLRKKNLWIRRINIRQVLSRENEFETKHVQEFREFKENVRREIDRPLLKEMFPLGTVLRDVYMEEREGEKTFGRQVGTYPLLVGVDYQLKLGDYYNIAVTGYGYRSITGVQHPIKIKDATYKQLQALPNIGKKAAGKIFRKKPKDMRELEKILDSADLDIEKYLSFE
ncbi:hypothetical protein AKJ52_01465 [candidate division MSBL1 archaeon SCGC-AAA382C18]|uniref:Radical SAM core domain-containing protein n=1 Tax=candidate division MSBL1 archaeon SCGC-AAA382C18 TaxID=1698281 RepID=A0A133VK56_9EURY|nr:hypothetical protein AKJ52_01465 [candidate division MSBL1 archaeon SCGC-AAA382C18]